MGELCRARARRPLAGEEGVLAAVRPITRERWSLTYNSIHRDFQQESGEGECRESCLPKTKEFHRMWSFKC